MTADSEKTNILIVDDLPEKILVYRTVLEELGQNLVTVSSGAEALKQVLTMDFAVVLLDVSMPGMDGFETAHLIRKRKRSAHTPIIFLTAFADEVRTSQGYATGAVDYLTTPIVPEILRAKVRVFVELFRMRQQVAKQAEEHAKRSAAEESARRSTFLSEASRALANSLDFEATLRTLSQVSLPFLADMSLLALVHEDLTIGRTECAWVVDGSVRQLPTNSAQPEDWLIDTIQQALRMDKTQWIDPFSLPGQPLRYELDPPAPVSPFSAASVLVLPLIARNKQLGVLVFLMGPSRRFVQLQDISLANELSGRASIALDNALLVRDIKEDDQRKNEFIAMLSHELRNPLAPVRNAIEILRLGSSNPLQINWARDVIDRQITHLVRMVDDLLDVSRITRGKIQLQTDWVEVEKVVGTAIELSQPIIQNHQHELIVSLPDHPIRLKADSTRLAQVLSNLLNNAAKYTPDGGKISLLVEMNSQGIVFRVRDTGVGIPREMLSKIFDLFTQIEPSLDRAQSGLGIGLTIVRRIVEMHEGTVQAWSEGKGKGTEFVVQLPTHLIDTQGNVSINNREPGIDPLNRQPRVLIVDDNMDAADSLALLLQFRSYEVQLAYDSSTALQMTDSFDPEVILLDIGLPGMDGYEVARRIRDQAKKKNILIVAITGYGQEEDRMKSKQAGFNYHLTKPIDYNTLEQVMVNYQNELQKN